MTRSTTTTLAVAADYADAMMVARRAKSWLFLLLLLILLVQVGIFCLARFVPGFHLTATVTTASAVTAPAGETPTTTHSVDVAVVEHPASPAATPRVAPLLFQYLINLTDFWGIISVLALSIVLLLVVAIMLVGRLVGVSHVTSAFVWCVLLILILLPWQTLFRNPSRAVRITREVHGHHVGDVVEASAEAARAWVDGGVAEAIPASSATTPDVAIPGVLYTWQELVRDYDFLNSPPLYAFLKWMRFVGWPVIAIIILLSVQARSSRGLRFALGESDVHVEVNAPPV